MITRFRGFSTSGRFVAAGAAPHPDWRRPISSDPTRQSGLTEYPPDILAWLQQVGAARDRYQQTRDPRFLNDGLATWELIMRSPDFPKLHEALRMQILDSAGELYIVRFKSTQEIADYDRGLALRRKAVLLMHRDWPEFPDFLSNLAMQFHDRYQRTQNARDLEEYGELVWQLPESHKNFFGHVTNLGIALAQRYIESGSAADGEEAIRCFRAALARCPEPASLPRALNNLAATLWNRYHRTKDERHLEEYEEIVRQFPAGCEESTSHRDNLVKGLWEQFERTPDAPHLEGYQRAVRQLPPDWEGLPRYLNNLGTAHFSLYESAGGIENLQESIQSLEQAIAGMPVLSLQPVPESLGLRSFFARLRGIEPSPDPDNSQQNLKSRSLSNLGAALMARYRVFGDPADLVQAIQTMEQSVDGTPKGSSETAARLANLGDALRLGYQRTRTAAELDAAMQKFDLAVAAAGGSPDLQGVLVSRGIGLTDRYERSHDVGDLKSAVADFRRAVDKTPPDSSDAPVYLNCLGVGLSELYERKCDMSDLNAGIDAFQGAVDRAMQKSSSNPGIPTYLNNLSTAYSIRYEKLGAQADLETAIRCSQQASAAIDPGSPELPALLANLGSRMSSLYKVTLKPADLDASIETWERGLRSLHASFPATPVPFKLGGERTWTALYPNLVNAYMTRMRIEPAQAQSLLRRAIEVAEEGKSRLLTEQFSRADVPLPDGIPAGQAEREKELLDELTRLDASELAPDGQLEAKAPGTDSLTRLRQRQQIRRELHARWTLMEKSGPPAAAYVALRRGDAPLWDDIERLADEMGEDTALLSLFTARDNCGMFAVRKGHEPRCIDGQLSAAGWSEVWSLLVREVHNYDRSSGAGETWDYALRFLLGDTFSASLGPVRRVILAPHALGHLIPWSAAVTRLGLRSADKSPLPIVTVPALRLAGGGRAPASGGKGPALVVGNPRGDLMFAEGEARAVAEKLKTKALIGPQATKESVLNRLAEAPVVHLATHAYLSVSSPMDSGVILADGVLTARAVMRYRLQTDLLVLSACQTGLGASLGGDELAGLSRAFMYAGVRSMLVSLWKVDDMATAALMTAFYDAWCGGSDKAEALSQAMKRVRAEKRWEHSYYWGAFALMGHWN